ncbi:MAG: tRNA pseudouridine(55) synthase TruB [Oscillospiraceae bacterium]|nr:tRNA pseudouridine(55) synthase TruB [Oscillospiraceae bacterium]MCI9668477.1 tRNA pseudouridine(55) synthase TruB [Oscillospiraceae bacterium]
MPYEGILLIDKPQGFTSFDVIAKLRGITKTKKIGHSGTLDPMATGVLPVFFGRAAKAVSILPREDKRYLAQVQLGITTDTQDLTGKVLEKRPVQAGPEEVVQAARQFTGEIQQIPPMYSALKVNGKKLCDLARQGIEVERQPRSITIYSLSARMIRPDLLELDVHCSKGTYIRTLAADLGEKLGCGGALSALRRTMAAGFVLKDCLSLEEVQALGNGLGEKLLPVEAAFSGLPQVQLPPRQARLFQNGVRLKIDQLQIHDPGRKAVFSEEGFLGTAFLEAGELRMEKLFRLADG